jgi:hypothetical protein
MGRIVGLLGLLVTLAACGVGGWATARRSLALFVVPNATDIQVAVLGWGEWQISYDAPDSPTMWYMDVAHQLEAQHWSSPDRVEYGALSRTYSRASSYGFGELWEWAFLTIDPRRPQQVRIRVRQQIAMRWS